MSSEIPHRRITDKIAPEIILELKEEIKRELDVEFESHKVPIKNIDIPSKYFLYFFSGLFTFFVASFTTIAMMYVNIQEIPKIKSNVDTHALLIHDIQKFNKDLPKSLEKLSASIEKLSQSNNVSNMKDSMFKQRLEDVENNLTEVYCVLKSSEQFKTLNIRTLKC